MALGIDRPISRRDFLNGIAIGMGAALAGFPLEAGAFPPGEFQGQTDQGFAVTHAIRDGRFWKNSGPVEATDEHYDLIVVGAGISGLASAFLFQQQAGASARILILENSEVFGGHARRNEFTASNGRHIIGYGGSESFQSPSFFSPAVLSGSTLPNSRHGSTSAGPKTSASSRRLFYPRDIRRRRSGEERRQGGRMGSANPACYVAEGRLRKVSADRGIFTGELPADQVEALNDQHKVPLIYANVLLRSWESLAKLGIARFTVPGGFWEECRIDYPVSIAATASLAARTSPCCSTSSRPRLARRGNREQSRAGRYALTDLTFAEMEFQIRDLLTRAVGPGGPARDVEAITINRWSHGYSYEYMRPWDRYWPQGKLPIDVFLPISSSLL